MSEERKNLIQALIAAQGEFPPLERSATARIPTKSGKEFSYSYAPLDALRGQTDAILHKHGLVVNHWTTIQDSHVILHTQLAFENGNESLMSEWPIGLVDDDPKVLGANMTYGERYTYSALTGRVAEDDSDAERTKAPKRPAPKHDSPPDDFGGFNTPPKQDKDSATLARESCMAKATELGLDDAWVKSWMIQTYSLKESRNEMTEAQWRDARQKLNEMWKGDKILEGQVATIEKLVPRFTSDDGANKYLGVDDIDFLAAVKAAIGVETDDIAKLQPSQAASLIDLLKRKLKAAKKGGANG